MRPFWSGQLSFGLVNIPVSVYTATESNSVDLDLLHKKDMARIRYKKTCEGCGENVSEDEIVKGYEHTKGEYVVLSQKDLQSLHPEGSDAIGISAFVNPDEISLAYFEKPYFLAPGKGAAKPYMLLREAMERSHKVAMAQYVFRHKEHLGVVAPEEEGLILYQVRFPRDFREPAFALPRAKLDKKELDLALDLVETLSGHFDPDEYEDHSRENFERLVAAKLKGAAPVHKAPAVAPTKVVDLVAMLRKSLEAEKKPARRKTTTARRKKAS